MKWLATLMPPKFYRYMYHKMVIMSVKFGNTTPYFSSVILMAMSTFFQLFFILVILSIIVKYDLTSFIFPNPNLQGRYVAPILVTNSLMYGYFHYLFFYYKEKYIKIMEEFKNETPKQTQIGIIYLFIYLVFSIILLFFPIILQVFFDIRLVWWK